MHLFCLLLVSPCLSRSAPTVVAQSPEAIVCTPRSVIAALMYCVALFLPLRYSSILHCILRHSHQDITTAKGGGLSRRIQFADARTSGTAVTRIFSILEVNNRNEDAAFDYMRKLKSNVQVYTKSGGGGTNPVGLGQAGMGIFFIVDALKTQQAGYDVVVSFPEEGIGAAAEGIALIKGAKHPGLAKKLIDWATTEQMQKFFAEYKINFIPAYPGVETQPTLTAVLKDANVFPIDSEYSGQNRKRIVDRWIDYVLQE